MSIQSPSSNEKKHVNTVTKVNVTQDDLPLHCPMNDDEAWCSHPRVFLAIESKKEATAHCPYCGTQYIMK